MDLSWIEISSPALAFNLSEIRRAAGPEAIISPCVKANAYGHGLEQTGRILSCSGADWLSVNSLEEARKLREGGISCPILVIGLIAKQDLPQVLDLGLRIFLYDKERAEILSSLAHGQKIPVHLKIDTGMHRQGVLCEKALDFVRFLQSLPGIEIEGLATHFATSDQPNQPQYYLEQLRKFKIMAEEIESFLGKKLITHCDKTASLFLNPEERFSLVRPGLATYGYFPNPETRQACEGLGFFLKPALTFKTRVEFLKDIPEGCLVG
ncbi:MAG: alanine racemase, partial [Patescibacteria group bacterium]